MVLAGGCATGTLFRVGEGNIQFMFALLGAVLSAPLFLVLLNKVEFQMSSPIWLVAHLGWQGALLLGFAQNFGVWYISSQWQDAIAFVILILFLLFKPEGFFGKKLRKQSV